jgi:hypothetical protein
VQFASDYILETLQAHLKQPRNAIDQSDPAATPPDSYIHFT